MSEVRHIDTINFWLKMYLLRTEIIKGIFEK